MITPKCPNCGEKVIYKYTAGKNDQYVSIFECVKCKEQYDFHFYRYNPSNCPKHQWEFDRWGFEENQYTHRIFWIMKCDRCGAVSTERRLDSGALGLREAVDLEDPRVLTLLDLNKQTARFHLPADDVADFWSS